MTGSVTFCNAGATASQTSPFSDAKLFWWFNLRSFSLEQMSFSAHSISPADRGTKKHVYLPYRGAIPFWFNLVPLRLVIIFLNVGHVEISCGFWPTHFLSILL